MNKLFVFWFSLLSQVHLIRSKDKQYFSSLTPVRGNARIQSSAQSNYGVTNTQNTGELPNVVWTIFKLVLVSQAFIRKCCYHCLYYISEKLKKTFFFGKWRKCPWSVLVKTLFLVKFAKTIFHFVMDCRCRWVWLDLEEKSESCVYIGTFLSLGEKLSVKLIKNKLRSTLFQRHFCSSALREKFLSLDNEAVINIIAEQPFPRRPLLFYGCSCLLKLNREKEGTK